MKLPKLYWTECYIFEKYTYKERERDGAEGSNWFSDDRKIEGKLNWNTLDVVEPHTNV